MVFIAILTLVTLAIAGSAAYFSIFGLAQIFSGAFWPVVIMASSLEAGKLVAASFAYRYRKKINVLMMGYLLVAILTLMTITSAGIFGFLSSAYQQDILPIKLQQQKLTLLEKEKAELESLKQERLQRKKQIDNDISALPNNYVTGRQRLLESYGSEINQLRVDIASYTKDIRTKTLQISEVKNKITESEVHVGPIIYIASVFNKGVDDATKWLIVLIIFAFDPLAVILTIGVNKALLEYKLEKSGRVEEIQPNNINEPSLFDKLKDVEIQIDTSYHDDQEREEAEESGDDSTLNEDSEVEIFTEPEPSVVDVSQLQQPEESKPEPKAEATPEREPIVADNPIVPRGRPANKVYKPHSYS